jgi:hypothetical protein
MGCHNGRVCDSYDTLTTALILILTGIAEITDIIAIEIILTWWKFLFLFNPMNSI